MALVQLRPQMSVSPEQPLEHDRPFSTPFRLANTGYFSLDIVQENCYIDTIKTEAGVTVSGGIMNTTQMRASKTLERGQSDTMVCRFTNSLITRANLTVVIDYKSWGIQHRMYFRFDGGRTSEQWEWLEQPMDEDLRKRADKAMDDVIEQSKRPSK
ncbi:MAG TPA: hypothetical protein VIH89_16625 [Candidatus Sulfotelmatobacter sp.]